MSTDLSALFMYGIFALGGIGVYFALPQEGRWPGRAAVVPGLAALAGFLVLLGLQFAPGDGGGLYWVLFAGIAVFAGTRVVTHDRPVYSAIYFVVVVLAVAGMLLLLSAEFVAVALVMVYGGAIIVTYAFVMMLAQHGGQAVYDHSSRAPLGAVLAGFVLTATLSGAVAEAVSAAGAGDYDAAFSTAAVTENGPLPAGNTAAVGATLLSRYMVPLELAGVLLLLAMVGAVAMARKRIPPTEADAFAPSLEQPLGEAGRQAPPFSPELKKV
jgi:NADH-quinone oxidoreductase subunit J